MVKWLKEIDELLRGNKTAPELLAEGTGQLGLGLHVGMALLLGAAYGVCMGLFSVLSRTPAVPQQLLASTVKVPLLFLCALAVTFPSLYVFSALLGARLSPLDALRVVVASVVVNLAVLASFGPITAFFTLTTTSYHFMKLLSVFFFGISGFIGLGFLLTTLRRLEAAAGPAVVEAERVDEGGVTDDPSGRELRSAGRALRADRPVSHRLFKVWVILYSLVGAQMAWILRPFIGTPDLPFTWFRQRGDNFFLDVLRTIGELFGG